MMCTVKKKVFLQNIKFIECLPKVSHPKKDTRRCTNSLRSGEQSI